MSAYGEVGMPAVTLYAGDTEQPRSTHVGASWMSSYCPNCGSPRLPQAHFCAGCGVSFGAIDAVQTPSASVMTPPSDAVEGTREARGDGALGGVAEPGLGNFASVQSGPVAAIPPVEASEAMSDAPRARRITALRVGLAALVVALLASVAQGYSTNQTLDHTKTDLADNQEALAGTQSQLDATEGQLSAETSARSQAEGEASHLQRQLSGLQDQLAARDACIAALKADEEELRKIQREQTTNFNRSAEDSALVKADAARDAALLEVAEDYYKAFSNAYDGNFATANSWVAKGNRAVDRADAQLKVYDVEIGKINAGTTKIDGEMAALSASITETLSLCGIAS